MLHRTTMFAIPILGLVLVGSGVGWWGYNQYQQRQALAVDSENQYNSTFHSLVDNMHQLQQELGKTLISNEPTGFQSRLRDIWRLDYVSQTEIGRLPFDLMPMHNTQQFLSAVSKQTDTWMESSVSPANPAVHKKLIDMYNQAGKINTSLAGLQTKVFDNQVQWSAVNTALRKNQRDNQVVDGFRKLDAAATAFVESEDKPATLRRGKSFAMAGQADVSPNVAKRAVEQAVPGTSGSKLTVEKTKSGAYRPEYIVRGSTSLGDMNATVSVDGGHLLSFDIHHTVTNHNYDLGDVEQKASQWLTTHGFSSVEVVQSNQYDGVGYFIYAPKLKDGSLVLSQGIAVKASLDNGSIVGYDANNYYYYPVKDLPSRIYGATELRKKLNPSFTVGMERSVVVLDKDQRYQPAVAFYGTSNDETFCVYMNAHTGKEMSIEQLT